MTTPAVNIKQISVPMGCGEGPHWDSERKLLFSVDIPHSLIFCYNPATEKTVTAKVEAPYVSFILPVKGTKDKFVVGLGLSVSVITWDCVSTKVPKSDIKHLFTVENTKAWRFNDGKTDPAGRVLAGTMGDQENGVFQMATGSLYSLEKGGKPKTMLTDLGIANGLAWTEDTKIFYYIDSLAYRVDALDYDIKTGAATNRRVVFDLKKNDVIGIPDGMTIDRKGNLWVALYGGSQVINIDPRTGKLIRRLPMPSIHVTSVAFMGDNLDQLVVTTANQDLPPGHQSLVPYAGATYIITGLGVSGYEGVPAVI